jgi:hypothetical protein
MQGKITLQKPTKSNILIMVGNGMAFSREEISQLLSLPLPFPPVVSKFKGKVSDEFCARKQGREGQRMGLKGSV